MSRYDLSILVPGRNEMFFAQTVKNLLENIRGNTEIIVVFDGSWADPGVPDDNRVTIIYNNKAVGQRGATNQAAMLSKAKYVMKLDAHCALDEGFDVKMIQAFEELPDGETVTMIPALYNLHAFDWKCNKCGNRWYQGAAPKHCQKKGTDGNKPEHINPDCDNTTDFERVIVWQPRWKRRSEFYRFDLDMHFQYHGARKSHPDAQGEIVETFSAQGSCFMLTRKKYWELGISEEKFGSWGQQGVEVACKTWLSGGRLVTNKRTWYSHMFRTQEGFGFPYPQTQKQIDYAREYSKELFLKNTWPQQIYPLSWLLEKFKPLPGWHDPEGKEMLDMVNKAGEEFYKNSPPGFGMKQRENYDTLVATPAKGDALTLSHLEELEKKLEEKKPTKGIIYYTDNQLNFKIAHKCRKQILRAKLPIVSVSLKPIDFGKNIHMKQLKRGYEAYFRQILTALENSDADIIYFCEHDWLYHPSHFDFTPERKDTFYYNWNWWRVRASDGYAVHYDTQLVPGLCAYRDLLIGYYKQVVAYLEEVGFTGENANKVGFEPGTHKRVDFTGKYKVARFDSVYPIIDIRHTNNLTSSKWSPDAFRNPKNAQNWKETESIPGWGIVKGRFDQFLTAI